MAVMLLMPGIALSWGPQGHSVVGILGVESVEPGARDELAAILGNLDEATIIRACNWPDAYRSMPAGQWSAPLHYVHIDSGYQAYSRDRDCPDRQCLPEAINRYAARLGDKDLSRDERAEAFSFLCHLVGDVHQPLHVGFVLDHGGNKVKVVFEGEQTSLHNFWDYTLFFKYSDSTGQLLQTLRKRRHQPPPPWRSPDTRTWTNESLTFTWEFAYPEDCMIANKQICSVSEKFAKSSWSVIQQQLDVAASRLAVVINAELGQ